MTKRRPSNAATIKAAARTADALELFRRMALGLCSHCGRDYDSHDPRPQSSCKTDCDHCHQSDFKAADDDPTLLGRDCLRLVWDAADRDRRFAEAMRAEVARCQKSSIGLMGLKQISDLHAEIYGTGLVKR